MKINFFLTLCGSSLLAVFAPPPIFFARSGGHTPRDTSAVTPGRRNADVTTLTTNKNNTVTLDEGVANSYSSIRNSFSVEPYDTVYISSDVSTFQPGNGRVSMYTETSQCPSDDMIGSYASLGLRTGDPTGTSDARALTLNQCKFICGGLANRAGPSFASQCKFAMWKRAEYQPTEGALADYRKEYGEDYGECLVFQRVWAISGTATVNCGGHEGIFLLQEPED